MLRLQGAHPYSGHPSGGWRPGLGQIPTASNFLGPTAFYNASPASAAPSGHPMMTSKITSHQPEPTLVGRQMGQVAVESPVSSVLFPVGLASAAALALVLLLLVD